MDHNQAFNALVQGIHAGVKAGAYNLEECAVLHSAIKLLTTPPPIEEARKSEPEQQDEDNIVFPEKTVNFSDELKKKLDQTSLDQEVKK